MLVDPSNRQDPLKGAQFWLEQLKGKGQLPPTVLVGARVDRGAPALAQQELDQFCQRYGIRGGYISTSALSGEGLEALLSTLKAQIPWEQMTATVTTVTFKRIKDYVLGLKEKPDRKGVLVSLAALREQLQATDKNWSFTDAELMTAVGHLETHGYVAILRSSAGEQHILLTPDLLASLAASIVLLADKNPRELGAVSEAELLQGQYPFDELKDLEKPEQQILLDAAILRFLQHNLCFRETFGNDTLLIFPGLIKQKRPLQDDLPATDDVSYVVRGRVENLYAMLVVLLGYTPSFTRINQWQNQAQYEMYLSRIKGFRRGWATPRCYLSRLPEQAEWAAELIHDLNDAGVYVVEQAGHVQPDDFVIVLDTPAYQQAFQAAAKTLEADAKLIRARWEKRSLISLALAGKAGSHEMEDCQPGAFCDDTHYIPIIVRDCLWQSEPVLKDLQALPTDGKAVLTFSEATGDRDKVWMEIAQAIEKRAREKAKNK